MSSNQQFDLPLTSTKCSRRSTDEGARQSKSRIIPPDSSLGMARGASAYAGLATLYLPEEVAAHLRVSIRTVKRFIASGRLKVTRFGRAPRIAEEDFLREGTRGIKTTVRAGSSSSGALRTASGTSAGTTPPLDRPIAFRLAQQTAKRRARRSTNMP